MGLRINACNNLNTNSLAFKGEEVNAGILTKPIETVQKTIETGVETFVGEEKDKKKKKTRSRAIIASSTVLVLGALTMLFNPSGSGKTLKRMRNLQSTLDFQVQKSKRNFFKNDVFNFFKKISDKVEKGMNFYFNLNSGKDIVFKEMCTNSNKKYPEFITKNKVINKIVNTVDKGFVKVFRKPHEKITQWFDSISKATVKNNYVSASKSMDTLESFFKVYGKKLPKDKQVVLEAKLNEISKAREAFSKNKVMDRLKKQESMMGELEENIWNRIYNKKDGFAKNSTEFWAQDALIKQKAQVEKEGRTLVEEFVGSKEKKGLYDEVLDIFADTLNEKEMKNIKHGLSKVSKKIKKANNSECLEYFDRKRDMVLGGAPTDIVTQIFGMSVCGLAVSTADKEDRLSKAFTTGVPVVVGLGSSLIFSALLYSGGVALLAGAAVGGVTDIVCSIINKHVFGNKDKEDIEKEEKSISKSEVKNV